MQFVITMRIAQHVVHRTNSDMQLFSVLRHKLSAFHWSLLHDYLHMHSGELQTAIVVSFHSACVRKCKTPLSIPSHTAVQYIPLRARCPVDAKMK